MTSVSLRGHCRSRALALTVSAFLWLTTGCAIGGSPTASTQSSSAPSRPEVRQKIRQTDERGIELPFVTPFPDRWSTNNDGTTYEPCTALTDAELRDAGLNASTAADAAVVNGQTVRGCIWRYTGGREAGVLSHFTGNTPTFEQNMVNRGRFEVSYDLLIEGRLVLVDSRGTMLCMTTVKSGRSPVSVIVTKLFEPIGREAVCKRAVDFTRVVIDRIPPPSE